MGSRGRGRDKEKKKDMRVNLVAGVKVEVRKRKRIFFKITGRLGSKITTATVPRQRTRNACWYFLTFTDKIRKRMKNTVVALHQEVFRVS